MPSGSTGSPTVVADNLAALRSGQLDAVQLFEPLVEEAVSSGVGHLWYQAMSPCAPSYTTFVTTRERLVRRSEAMRRGEHRTQRSLAAATAAAMVDAVRALLSALDRALFGGLE